VRTVPPDDKKKKKNNERTRQNKKKKKIFMNPKHEAPIVPTLQHTNS
jgi:hypothetical protein